MDGSSGERYCQSGSDRALANNNGYEKAPVVRGLFFYRYSPASIASWIVLSGIPSICWAILTLLATESRHDSRLPQRATESRHWANAIRIPNDLPRQPHP